MEFNAIGRAASRVVHLVRAGSTLVGQGTSPSTNDAQEDRLHFPWRNPMTWKTAINSLAVAYFEEPGRATYDELTEQSQLFAQMHWEAWPTLLRFVNKKVLPYLPTEEAAIQLVAQKLAYCHPRQEDCLFLDIRRSVRDQLTHYSKSYRTDRTYACEKSAVVAWRLRPTGADASSAAALIVLRGTSPGAGLRAEGTEDFLTGIADDFEHGGIGLSGFRRNEELLSGWVSKLLKFHPIVVVTGHSLGGAYAARLMASLSPETQKKVRLLTYNAPALDSSTAEKICPGQNNVRLVRHHDDFVHLAGELHPHGWVITQFDLATAPDEAPIAHSLMPMVRASLDEGNHFRPQTKMAVKLDAGRKTPELVERGRKFAAFWGAGVFPA